MSAPASRATAHLPQREQITSEPPRALQASSALDVWLNERSQFSSSQSSDGVQGLIGKSGESWALRREPEPLHPKQATS